MPSIDGGVRLGSLAWRWPLVVASVVAGMYVAFGFFSPDPTDHGVVYPVWPASGINMGLLWLFGIVCWPAVAIGSLLGNLLHYNGNPEVWRFALLGPIGDTAEAVLGVILVRKAAGDRHLCPTLSGAARFIFLGAIIATGIGAFLGIWLLDVDHEFRSPKAAAHAMHWFVSTSLAVLVIVPFMTLWAGEWKRDLRRGGLYEAMAIAALLGVVQGWLFFRVHEGAWIPPGPMVMLSLPLVFWAGSRFGVLGGAWAVLFASVTAIAGTRLGFGPFAQYHDGQALTVLQVYLAIIAVVGVIVGAVARERDDARRALEHRASFDRFLFDELNHRVRNTLASLLSILDLNKTTAASVDEYASLVSGRIHAMARVHDLLTNHRWKPVSFRDVVEGVLAGADRSRVEIVGETVMLAPAQATAVGMIVHELLSNARKHGAHAASDGVVRIAWSYDADRRGPRHLHWEWVESGSFMDRAAGAGGVMEGHMGGDGLRLIEGLARSDLRGRAELSITPGGVHHRFDVLLDETIAEPAYA